LLVAATFEPQKRRTKMNPAEVLDAKSVFAVPPGTPLVIQWNAEGTRAGAAQIIVARKARELVLAVWRGGTSFGGKFDVWTLKVDGRSLIETRQNFRCELRLPTAKELASIKDHLEKFPAPAIPLEGQYVKIHYLEVEPGEELTEIVGTVTAQRFDDMTVEAHYFSGKQCKVVHEPIVFDRNSARWIDHEIEVECAVAIIDRVQFDRWLAEDEKAQKSKLSPPKVTSPVTKPASKPESKKQ
jgi:hypothetical protein